MRIIGNDPSIPRQEHAVASGALTDGKAVTVNADGTVSVISESSVTQAIGSAVTFESARVTYISSTFDSNVNRVVIVYADRDNGFYLTYVVGTVSSNSISFGTPGVISSSEGSYAAVTFDSNANKVVITWNNGTRPRAVVGTVDASDNSMTFGSEINITSGSGQSGYNAIAFDSSTNKVVIAFRDGSASNYGRAVVGTVSGTSISVGSEVYFANSQNTAYICIAFDSNVNRIVIGWGDSTNQKGKAIVGEVSGTSITFGTEAIYNNAGPAKFQCSVFDSTNNKVAIFHHDNGNSDYGTAVVGTVDSSDDSISFGTAVIFNEATTNNTPNRDGQAVYDTSAKKIVFTYMDRSGGGTKGPGTLKVAEISGTTISFDSAVTYESGDTESTTTTFDSNSNKVVIAFEDDGDSEHGKGIVFQVGYTATTLTSENYIGITRSGAASGAGAIINTQGAIADNLSGLTAGQSYFVQTDGTLSTTAASPSVFAGTAVSATKLIVKG